MKMNSVLVFKTFNKCEFDEKKIALKCILFNNAEKKKNKQN